MLNNLGIKDLFTWERGIPSRWGTMARWGPEPFHIISLFSFTVFTWELGYPTEVVSPVSQGGGPHLAGVTFLYANTWGGVHRLPGVRFIRGLKVQICVPTRIVLVHFFVKFMLVKHLCNVIYFILNAHLNDYGKRKLQFYLV